MERTRAVGLLLAVLSASAFGVMPVLTKVVYEGGTGALGVLSVRFTLAAVVLLALGRLRREAWQLGGVLLGLGAAVSYAGYIVLSSRVAGGLGPFTSAGVVMASCALVYDVLAVATRTALPSSARAWSALVAVALVGTVVAVSAFFAALERLGPADTSVVSTVEPLVSVLVAAAVLGERLGPLQLAGGMLVLGAVVALARLRPVPAVVPDEREVPV